ncbi:hypothetical protein E6O75_ATG09999 [Venturia nashicola]|uniref:BTB domain-containing protein n=1 Tax=Venturia nashicola TaxID=86259 RepID=A0A4Z1NCF1_9PEZI|nr:hypothetical protein E6O75_ATG09999 [Venturia nashicola]
MPASDLRLSTVDSPSDELMNALGTLFELGKYSDLTITSGIRRYAVHKAIVCSRSGFFDGACSNPFKESESGTIDLSEDDPEAVDHMVHYFYHLEYLTTPRVQPQGTTLSSPLASPISQKHLSFDSIIDENHSEVDEIESAAEQQAKGSASNLTLHAKVYAIAEKYGIQGLKTMAKNKFSAQMAYHWDSPEVPLAIQEVYETTVDSDRGLRDVITSTFRCYPELAQRRDVEAVVKETPELAWELFRVGWDLPLTLSS